MIKIIAYTDGSAVVKGKCVCEEETCPKCNRLGGIGAYIKYNDKEIHLSKGYKNTTISRMEMKSLLYVIQKVPENLKCKLIVYSDSQFVCKAFSEGWLEGWKRDNFLGRKNSDIWKNILNELDLRKQMVFEIQHTRGHLTDLTNHIVYGNHIADALADYRIHKSYSDDVENGIYYYYHDASDTLYSSYNDWDVEIKHNDGNLEPISKERALELMKELPCYYFNTKGEIEEHGINEDDIPF